MKTITFEIPRNGLSNNKAQVQVATTGFVGAGCKAATEVFEKALGQVTEDIATAEMHLGDDRVETVKDN